ncbi:hypothetical protein FB446DRAFT_786162 [Lentinula raphanica]|nr:hypothetical protein FB446DRAFT_786162 [Lentinula raphanica]
MSKSSLHTLLALVLLILALGSIASPVPPTQSPDEASPEHVPRLATLPPERRSDDPARTTHFYMFSAWITSGKNLAFQIGYGPGNNLPGPNGTDRTQRSEPSIPEVAVIHGVAPDQLYTFLTHFRSQVFHSKAQLVKMLVEGLEEKGAQFEQIPEMRTHWVGEFTGYSLPASAATRSIAYEDVNNIAELVNDASTSTFITGPRKLLQNPARLKGLKYATFSP